MKKYSYFTCVLLTISSSVLAFPAKQVLQLSYYDDERVTAQMPQTPNFMRSNSDMGVDRGVMGLYEYTLFDVFGAISIHAGANVGRWHSGPDQIVTGSAFLSGRLWVFHLLFIHPYVEYSLLGPTLISKEVFSEVGFSSNVLFQNFFGVGVEVGEGRGFSVDLKTIRYYHTDTLLPQQGFRVPVVASIGVLF